MAKREESGGSRIEPIELDVLIIGGGIMGLWLLNDLRQAGYAALLLERQELGGEQTCHSHVYIHQGHLYKETRLAAHLKEGTGLWENWLQSHFPTCEATGSYFGFRNSADAQVRLNLWDDPMLQLGYEPVPPDAIPAALRGGPVTIVYRTPEICLNGASLVRALAQDVDTYISRIETVENFRLNTASDTVEEVTVTLPRGVRFTFLPRAVIFTAGAGNQALLERVSGGQRTLLGRVRERPANP